MSELQNTSPAARGWQSPRWAPQPLPVQTPALTTLAASFASYPQELTLRLETPSRLTQIQILSHEYKASARAHPRPPAPLHPRAFLTTLLHLMRVPGVCSLLLATAKGRAALSRACNSMLVSASLSELLIESLGRLEWAEWP